MTLTIAFSHRDVTAARRLVAWIGHMSIGLRGFRLVIVPSRAISAHPMVGEIVDRAKRSFGEVVLFIPPTEREGDWPVGPNYMFSESLRYVSGVLKDDMFWLEPDAIPTKPDWLLRIDAAWATAKAKGRRFMGNYVLHQYPHMTGNAVYCKEWERYAPCLGACPLHTAFDVWSAPEVLPQAYITKLIQHVWKPAYIGVALLDPEAVVFHQDKEGVLIGLLDSIWHNGDFELREEVKVMKRYYETLNASAPIKHMGYKIEFTRTHMVGGAWQGVYATDNIGEQTALAALRDHGIREISEAEYEAVLKKKELTQRSLGEWKPSSPFAVTRSPVALVEDEGRVEEVPQAPVLPEQPPVESLKLGVVKTSEGQGELRPRQVKRRGAKAGK